MREALGFLTPLGGARRPTPAALLWFGPVGALIGLSLGGLWCASAHVWPRPVAAAVVVVADLAITGMLHLDGLADAADGLLGHLGTERRLAVMAQSDVGAFGIGAVVAALLVRWSALAALGPSPLLLAALWCASRTAMAATASELSYARPGGGLATAFRGEGRPGRRHGVLVRRGVLAASLCAAVAVGAASALPAGLVGVLAGLAAFGAVVALAHRRIGGFTGDVLGAAGIVAESAGLLVVAARW